MKLCTCCCSIRKPLSVTRKLAPGAWNEYSSRRAPASLLQTRTALCAGGQRMVAEKTEGIGIRSRPLELKPIRASRPS